MKLGRQQDPTGNEIDFLENWNCQLCVQGTQTYLAGTDLIRSILHDVNFSC